MLRIDVTTHTYIRTYAPGAMAESVEHGSRVREIVGSNPWSSEINAYQIDTCGFLSQCLVLLGQDKDRLAQCQDNVTEWDVWSWSFGLVSQ